MKTTKTPDQVRGELRKKGMTLASWARAHGYAPRDVYCVMCGIFKGNYGRCHEIAVKLGLKDGEVVA